HAALRAVPLRVGLHFLVHCARIACGFGRGRIGRIEVGGKRLLSRCTAGEDDERNGTQKATHGETPAQWNETAVRPVTERTAAAQIKSWRSCRKSRRTGGASWPRSTSG